MDAKRRTVHGADQFEVESGPSGRFQPIISIVNRVRVGLTASITWRQFSTVASKNSRVRFFL